MKRKHRCLLCDNEFAVILAGINIALLFALYLQFGVPQQ